MKGKCSIFSVYNGVTWDAITGLYKIGGGGRTREDVEDDDLLDCGTVDYRQAAPGSKRLNAVNVEYRWDPQAGSPTNQTILETLYDGDAEFFIRVKYPDDTGSGEIWNVYIKELGDTEKAPNDTVKREAVFMPTGKTTQAYVLSDDIDAVIII